MKNIKESIKKIIKKVTNTLEGPDFNRSAHEESSKKDLIYKDPDTGSHEEWEPINMGARTFYDSDEGEFNIPREPGILERTA